MRPLAASLLVLPLPAGVAVQDAEIAEPPREPATRAAVVEAFAEQGILLAVEDGACALPVAVEVTDELLEYLLVLPHGASHEALFRARPPVADRTDLGALEAWAQSLNAALLALGIEPGRNAEWIPKDPPPTEEELRAGVSPYDVRPPEGDGLYLYATWREGDELFFYRVEDLVRDLDRRRTMRRHRWVYLGSRTITRSSDGEQAFAAAIEGNLINVSFFAQGNTLLTAAVEEARSQTRWLPNAWLLPGRGAEVLLLFSRERLAAPPASLAAAVPSVDPDLAGGGPR